MGFAARSLLLLSVLYSLVFAVADFALLDRQAPVWAGVLFVAVFVGAQYRLSPWMRLRALNREAAAQGQQAAYPLPEGARARRTGFPVEFLVSAAPLVCGLLLLAWAWIGRDLRHIGVEPPQQFVPWLLIALGVTWGARIGFRYYGDFEPGQVKDLIADAHVSQMRPHAIEIEGEIVGHGVPGASWSPDLVLKDDTGLMFLYYRSSIPLGRLVFAMRSADRLIGEHVKVHGWYRRGLQPYIELSRIEALVPKPAAGSGPVTLFGKAGQKPRLDYEWLVERSYSRSIQLIFSAAFSAAGIVLLLGIY
jgi:hypothetical protein